MPASADHTPPALAPVAGALAAVRRRRGPGGTAGLADGLVVTDPAGWLPASALVSGERLDDLLAAAARCWQAAPPAAAALAWRMYTYWLVMPPVLGWATARRVPLVDPDDVLVRLSDTKPLVTIGFRRVRVAALADDPLAGGADADPVADERGLLTVVRRTLRTDHCDPIMAGIRDRVQLGTRTLLGSLASAVAYAVVRGMDAPPDEVVATAATVLSTLDAADLVALEPGGDGRPVVWRHTCCLAFTIPEPSLCSGCPLRRAPVPAVPL